MMLLVVVACEPGYEAQTKHELTSNYPSDRLIINNVMTRREEEGVQPDTA